MSAPGSPADLDHRLRERFGLDAFRPWQREAVEELLDGRRRVLVVAPTGGGKSLCYQFPATELPGTTLVISPLIALMQDQVAALRARGIEATFLASTLGSEIRRAREAAMSEGRYRLVYLAPERLAHGGFVETLARLRPALIAIDEAHCISQWGHDFRPDYLRLGEILRRLAPPRVLACTATATPSVRAEILDKLGLPPAGTAVILRGFARPNLHLAVRELDKPAERRAAALEVVDEALGARTAARGAAIVYCATRRESDELAERAKKDGWRAAAYHAGLAPTERAEVSRGFSDRSLDVIAATNAFGMGIDRPDIRAVIHVQAPGSIEAYYQEVGRAGRDGAPAHGLLLTGPGDFGLRRRLIQRVGSADERGPDDPEVKRQWRLFLELLRYVEAGSCRHDFILRYFGDEGELLGGCGHCDVCERLEREGTTGGEVRSISAEDKLIVRKALAGVARAKGVGLQAIAQMLRGEENARVRKLGLERHSTFGLLRDRDTRWIVRLLSRLIAAGLLDVTASDYPVLYLTPQGREVMHDRQPARVLLPDPDAGAPPRARARAASERASTEQHTPADPRAKRLFDRLKERRLSIAQARGVPAYVICHDRTLAEIAARRPTSRDQLLAVYGMGPGRWELCGAALLDVVATDIAPS